MKTLFFFISSLLIIQSHAQSIKDLDLRNGFKTIKLGESYYKYQSRLKVLSRNDHSTVYEYTPFDDDLYNVFDTKMLQILLTFDTKAKLTGIMLHKAFNDEGHFSTAVKALSDLDDKFLALFGKASSKIDDKSDGRLGLMWIGSKVMLMNYVEYHGLNKGSDLNVVISSVEDAENSLKAGF